MPWGLGGKDPVLKQNSAITEALSIAKERIARRLQDATTKYFQSIGTLADNGKRQLTPIDDLAVVRREVVERERIFREESARAYKEFDQATQRFDTDSRELEAWIVAATASDKVRAAAGQ